MNLVNLVSKLNLTPKKILKSILVILLVIVGITDIFPWIKERASQVEIARRGSLWQFENVLEQSLLSAFESPSLTYTLKKIDLPTKMYVYQLQLVEEKDKLSFDQLKSIAEVLGFSPESESTSVERVVTIFDQENYLTYNRKTGQLTFQKSKFPTSQSESFPSTASLVRKVLSFWKGNNLPPSDLSQFTTQEFKVNMGPGGEEGPVLSGVEGLLIKFIPSIEEYSVETDKALVHVTFNKDGEIVGFVTQPFSVNRLSDNLFHLKSWDEVKKDLTKDKGYWEASSCLLVPEQAQVLAVETVYFSTDSLLNILPCFKIKAKLFQKEQVCNTEIYVNALKDEYLD